MQNIAGLLQKAGKIQQKLAALEKEMADSSFEGQSGGGMVKVTIKGSGDIANIDFDDSLLTAEEKGMLCDLISAAFNEARRKLNSTKQEKMQEITGGMPLPPGLGF